MEEELELEDPTESGDDVDSLEDEGDKGAAMTLVERRVPAATSVGGGHNMETHGDTPESRKRAVGEDAAREWEAKLARSPCPLEASLAS